MKYWFLLCTSLLISAGLSFEEEPFYEPVEAEIPDFHFPASTKSASILPEETEAVISVEQNAQESPQNLTLKPSFQDKSIDEQRTSFPVTIEGDFLYLKANEEGLNYAFQDNNLDVDSPPFPYTVIGPLAMIKPDYQPGFRLSATGCLPYDQWDISASWLRYTTTTNSAQPDQSGTLTWFYFAFEEDDEIGQGASAQWQLHLNTIDCTLGREIALSKHLSSKPHIGFIASWIHQKFDTTLLQPSDGLFILVGNEIITQCKNNFNGYGISLGCDTNWRLGKGWSLLFNARGALLSGHFSLGTIAKLDGSTYSDLVFQGNTLIAPMIEAFGGVEWKMKLEGTPCHLSLRAGWEQQIWFQQNQISIPLDLVNTGDLFNQKGTLSLSGVNASLTVSY